MNMSHPNAHPKIKEARTKIDESIESIKAIHGNVYADIVLCYVMSMHLTRMVAILAREKSRETAEAVGEQLTGTLSSMMDLIVDGHNISDKTIDEIQDWAIRLTGHIDHGIEQAARGSK
jgi:CRISPR/Cas system CSM-associated protein Csm2 small subunit